MNEILFRFVGYFIPEFIPAMTQLITYYIHERKKWGNMTVDDLYLVDEEERSLTPSNYSTQSLLVNSIA